MTNYYITDWITVVISRGIWKFSIFCAFQGDQVELSNAESAIDRSKLWETQHHPTARSIVPLVSDRATSKKILLLTAELSNTIDNGRLRRSVGDKKFSLKARKTRDLGGLQGPTSATPALLDSLPAPVSKWKLMTWLSFLMTCFASYSSFQISRNFSHRPLQENTSVNQLVSNRILLIAGVDLDVLFRTQGRGFSWFQKLQNLGLPRVRPSWWLDGESAFALDQAIRCSITLGRRFQVMYIFWNVYILGCM